MSKRPAPTTNERLFSEDDVIVSKTNAKGHIVYANDVFCKVGLYSEPDLLGKPHSIVRHPDMPRSVFQILWQRIQEGEEIFAYVKNLAKNGDYYWVFAHVTPTIGPDGSICGYHSNRRVPDRAGVERVEQIYREMRVIESRAADLRTAMQASWEWLNRQLRERNQSYDEFVFSVSQ